MHAINNFMLAFSYSEVYYLLAHFSKTWHFLVTFAACLIVVETLVQEDDSSKLRISLGKGKRRKIVNHACKVSI